MGKKYVVRFKSYLVTSVTDRVEYGYGIPYAVPCDHYEFDEKASTVIIDHGDKIFHNVPRIEVTVQGVE